MKIEPCSDFLRKCDGKNVFLVRRRLEVGDFVPYCYMSGAGWFGYTIDSSSAKRAQHLMGGNLDFGFVEYLLPGKNRKSEYVFSRYGARDGSRIVVPFSKAMAHGAGSSVERSIFVQLCAQDSREIYLVHGAVGCEEHAVSGAGAFNVTIDDTVDVLIDGTNKALSRVGENADDLVIPYIAPLCGVADGRFRFQLPSDAKYRACTLEEYKEISEPVRSLF